MATDIADWSSSVVVQSGSVSITGTATVSISGTPTVQFAAGQTVNIGNTPAVTISSGSVTIANASIAVINASGTKITSARPPKSLAIVGNSVNPRTVTLTLDADVHAIVVNLTNALSSYVHVKVAWRDPGTGVPAWVPFELYSFQQQVYVFPITPFASNPFGTDLTQIDLTIQGTAVGNITVELIEIFEGEPEWLTIFPQPQISPNQVPGAILKTLAANTAQWLIAPVANVQISLFELIELYTTNFGAGDVVDVGHAVALPANQGAATGKLIEIAPLGAVSFVYPFHGAQLPRGEGIYVINSLSAAGNFGCAINYSLS